MTALSSGGTMSRKTFAQFVQPSYVIYLKEISRWAVCQLFVEIVCIYSEGKEIASRLLINIREVLKLG